MLENIIVETLIINYFIPIFTHVEIYLKYRFLNPKKKIINYNILISTIRT